MSIEKKISSTLSNLIAEANYTLENAKDRILAVYDYAVKKDGFTPSEARDLVEKKIVNVTNRYIRKILPEEAKKMKHTPKTYNTELEPVPVHTEQQPQDEEKELEDGFVIPDENRDRSKDKKINITTAYDIQEVPEEQDEEEEQKPRTWQFKTTVEIKGQDVPLIVTVYPDTATGKVEVDEQAVKRFNKRGIGQS